MNMATPTANIARLGVPSRNDTLDARAALTTIVHAWSISANVELSQIGT